MARKILITDLHFGIHQNSQVWFNSQLDFFYLQFIPFLRPDDIVYCLGDVFDVRSSINAMLAKKVRSLFEVIAKKCSKIYIIGGNHDYFSPSTDEFCSLDLILSNINNLELVTHDILELENDVLIPWYPVEENGIENLSKKFAPKTIFTHTNLFEGSIKLATAVFSGHIHNPRFEKNKYNLGSTFPLTFADNNAERGFYSIENAKIQFHPNEHCIRFWRCQDDSCLQEEWWTNKSPKDYIELYLEQENLYNELINEKKKQYPNLNVILKTNILLYESTEIKQDIKSIIKSNIPENLKDIFNIIEDAVNAQYA